MTGTCFWVENILEYFRKFSISIPEWPKAVFGEKNPRTQTVLMPETMHKSAHCFSVILGYFRLFYIDTKKIQIDKIFHPSCSETAVIAFQYTGASVCVFRLLSINALLQFLIPHA